MARCLPPPSPAGTTRTAPDAPSATTRTAPDAPAATSCTGPDAPDGALDQCWGNEQQSYTATCPAGSVTESATVVIPPGTYFGATRATANALALAAATSQATAARGACTWENTVQTASCPGSSIGDDVVIPAGEYSSTVSQEDADNLAAAAAEAGLSCHWENVEQTAECDEGFTGDPVAIPAGTYTSLVSQEDADAQALAAAEALLECVPEGPQAGVATFVSRAGSGNLRGWSKFQNHNSGDWNLRKHTRRNQSGDLCAYLQANPECGFFWGSAASFRSVWSGYGLWNVTTNLLDDANAVRVASSWDDVTFLGDPPGCHPEDAGEVEGEPNYDSVTDSDLLTWVQETTACPVDLTYIAPDSLMFAWLSGSEATQSPRILSLQDFSAALTSGDCTDTWFTTSCVADKSYRAEGTGAVNLALPDTVAAALARGSPTIGILNKTLATSIGSTSAGSTAQIAITGRSSTGTIPLTNLTPAQAYTIDVTLNRYTAGGGALVDQVVVQEAFVAGAASENFVWDLPVGDFDYEYVSHDNPVAA